ncbi:hypothetical protein PHLCEN_2v12979 [Hermanssonia centrifuga]|uniref:Uncharacterized protein n=1 Tax=Hermanssonia centrifuga TaxID=98765 RepID=A0A2R6NFI5_9APHY|nr:hypothetical protein PHLCEN_2v12979 [Hermanssonia centrifuga]
MLSLRSIVKNLPFLVQALNGSRSQLLQIVQEANYNRLLDVARETYKENIGDIFALNTALTEEHEIPLTLVYQDTGFVFTLKKTELEGELPRGFINVTSKKGKWVFSSVELVRGRIKPFTENQNVTSSAEEEKCKNERCPRRDVDLERQNNSRPRCWNYCRHWSTVQIL